MELIRVNMKFSVAYLAISALLAGLGTQVSAQNSQPLVYSCTDAKGRKLTADRPISECSDREQTLLNPSGSVKGKIGPSLSEQDRQLQDAAVQKQARQVALKNEEERRERALIMRYPSKTSHEKERAHTLAQIEVVTNAASQRVVELTRQRVEFEAEMEFYKKESTLALPVLRRQLQENSHSLAVQRRFIAEQQSEMKRINARFDDELSRLRAMWAVPATPVEGTPPGKTR